MENVFHGPSRAETKYRIRNEQWERAEEALCSSRSDFLTVEKRWMVVRCRDRAEEASRFWDRAEEASQLTTTRHCIELAGNTGTFLGCSNGGKTPWKLHPCREQTVTEPGEWSMPCLNPLFIFSNVNITICLYFTILFLYYTILVSNMVLYFYVYYCLSVNTYLCFSYFLTNALQHIYSTMLCLRLEICCATSLFS